MIAPQEQRDQGAPRLTIGPSNSAGQAHAWAAAVREHLGVEARSASVGGTVARFTPTGRFAFETDILLPHRRLGFTGRRRAKVERILKESSHLALDGFFSLGGDAARGALTAEIQEIVDRGVRTALVSHGSDTRNPDAHIARFADSYFALAPSDFVTAMRKRSSDNRGLAQRMGLPLFVSTPDLLDDNPGATWLPLVVPPHFSPRPRARRLGEPPTVLHLPSTRQPAIKGTDFIDPVLRALHDSSRIRYVSPERVRHRDVPALLETCDIVVDQLLTGSYGVAAVEAMAAGKIVVGNLSPSVRSRIGQRVPIIDAPPKRFDRIMTEIVEDLEAQQALAQAGISYVAEFHDGRLAASILGGFLGTDSRTE